MWTSPDFAYCVWGGCTAPVSLLCMARARRWFAWPVLGSPRMGRSADHSLSRALARADAGKALSVDDLEALLGARGGALEDPMATDQRLRELGYGTAVTYPCKAFIPLTTQGRC